MLDSSIHAQLVSSCWFLTGPTASGKTDVGVYLAEQLSAEIISVDSMALYRGMDLGTAKPSPALRARVRHHLLDVVDPDQDFSLHDYLSMAYQAVREVQGRGRTVLFVGGTPLYLKGLLCGILDGPPPDWALREQLRRDLERDGPAALHGRLAALDPAAAARLHPHNTRRVIRALEFFQLRGTRLSDLQTQFQQSLSADQYRVFWLQWPREVLRARIDERVEQMFADGLLEEMARLVDRYGNLGRTAEQAAGYREARACLSGQLSRREAIEITQRRTRQLAKRQETWFRGLGVCRPIGCDLPFHAERLAKLIHGHDSNLSSTGLSV